MIFFLFSYTYQEEEQESATAGARHACGLPHSSAEPTVNALCPDYLPNATTKNKID